MAPENVDGNINLELSDADETSSSAESNAVAKTERDTFNPRGGAVAGRRRNRPKRR